MPARLAENDQFINEDKPIVDGKIYIGAQNLDTKLNLIPIFSDRELTIPLANPQILDSEGRSVNKIWVSARYSVVVDDVDDVLQYSDPDAGEFVSGGTETLSNIQGTNDITGEGSPTISEYKDGEIYTYTVANTNTGDVTNNWDGVDPKSVRINFDQQVRPGQHEAGMIVKCTFNELADYFEWTNQNLKTVHWTKGDDLASNATINIPNDGNMRDITGNATIAQINGVAGTYHIFQLDSTASFTDSANLIIGADYNGGPGDVIELFMVSDTVAQITDISVAGRLPRNLARNFDTVTVGNTTTATSAFSFSVPAKSLGTNRSIRARISGTYQNSSGGAVSLSILLNYGASTVAQNDITNNLNEATLLPFTLDVYLHGDDSVSAQKGDFTFIYGDNVTNGEFQISGYGTSAEDSTGVLTFDLKFQHSVANAGIIIVKEVGYANLE